MEAVQQPDPEQLGTTVSRPARKNTTRALSQRTLDDIDAAHVRALAAAQLSPAEIAATLSCDEGRLARDFDTEITQGHHQGNGAIKRKIHKLALVDETPWALKCRWEAQFVAEKQAAQQQECPRCAGINRFGKEYASLTKEQRIMRLLEIIEALVEVNRWNDSEMRQLHGVVSDTLAVLRARYGDPPILPAQR